MKYLFCLLFATMVLTNTSFGQLTKLTDFKTTAEDCSAIDQMYNFNDTLSFVFGIYPSKLWKYNNTKNELKVVSSAPTDFNSHFACGKLGDKLLFFRAKTDLTQLVSYDIITGNIEVVRAINYGNTYTCKPILLNNKYYYIERNSSTFNLIVTDGTVSGTKVLYANNDSPSYSTYLFSNSGKLYGYTDNQNGIEIIWYPLDGSGEFFLPSVPKMNVLYEVVPKNNDVVFLFGVNYKPFVGTKNYIYEYNLKTNKATLLRESDGDFQVTNPVRAYNNLYPFERGYFTKEFKGSFYFVQLNEDTDLVELLKLDQKTSTFNQLAQKDCPFCLTSGINGFIEFQNKLYVSNLYDKADFTIFSIDSIGTINNEFIAGDNNNTSGTYSELPQFLVSNEDCVFQQYDFSYKNVYNINLKTKEKKLLEANLETFYYHEVSPTQTLMLGVVNGVYNLYSYIGKTTATKNLQLAQLYNIAPNPSNGYWKLNKDANLTDEKVNYIVTDINGREITKGQSHGSIEINGQDWANGVYILSLKTNTLYQTVKLIKQ